AAEPLGASRRVRAGWERTKAGAFRRFLGPSVANTGLLQILLGGVLLVGLGVVAAIHIDAHRPYYLIERMVAFVGYILAFFVFLVGFAVWVRTRIATPLGSRILVVVL